MFGHFKVQIIMMCLEELIWLYLMSYDIIQIFEQTCTNSL